MGIKLSVLLEEMEFGQQPEERFGHHLYSVSNRFNTTVHSTGWRSSNHGKVRSFNLLHIYLKWTQNGHTHITVFAFMCHHSGSHPKCLDYFFINFQFYTILFKFIFSISNIADGSTVLNPYVICVCKRHWQKIRKKFWTSVYVWL